MTDNEWIAVIYFYLWNDHLHHCISEYPKPPKAPKMAALGTKEIILIPFLTSFIILKIVIAEEG